MTAADIPTTTGMPNNGFEGMRFLGYPIFEGLILWDLTRSDVLGRAPAGPGREVGAGQGRPDQVDLPPAPGRQVPRRLGLQRGRGRLEPRAVLQPAVQAVRDRRAAAITRARNPWLKAWRKIDDYTVEITHQPPGELLPLRHHLHADREPDRSSRRRRSWAEYAKAPAGTGPFKITERQAARQRRADEERRLLGQEQDPQARQDGAVPDARADHAPGRAALGPGRLDRGAAARRGAEPQAGGVRGGDRRLPARLAVGVQRGQGRLALARRAGAPGGQLLRGPRGAGQAPERGWPIRRSASTPRPTRSSASRRTPTSSIRPRPRRS